MSINLTDSNFESEVLRSELPVLVDFWAEWCMPCQMLSPVIEEIAQQYQGKLKVCKLNVDQAPQIAAKYQIMGIPTLILFKDGQAKEKIVGVVPKEKIEEKISPYI